MILSAVQEIILCDGSVQLLYWRIELDPRTGATLSVEYSWIPEEYWCPVELEDVGLHHPFFFRAA